MIRKNQIIQISVLNLNPPCSPWFAVPAVTLQRKGHNEHGGPRRTLREYLVVENMALGYASPNTP